MLISESWGKVIQIFFLIFKNVLFKCKSDERFFYLVWAILDFQEYIEKLWITPLFEDFGGGIFEDLRITGKTIGLPVFIVQNNS